MEGCKVAQGLISNLCSQPQNRTELIYKFYSQRYMTLSAVCFFTLSTRHSVLGNILDCYDCITLWSMFYLLLPARKVCQRVQRSDWHLDIIFSILNLIFTHFFKYFVHTFLYWLSSYRSLIFILKWSDAQPSACHTRYHQINCQITGGGDFTKPFYHKTRLDKDILFFLNLLQEQCVHIFNVLQKI